MSVLMFGFSDGVSKEVVLSVKGRIEKQYFKSNVEDIKNFVESTDFDKYDYVIGCGIYSRKDCDRIRIEKLCCSQFRNNKTNLNTLAIPYFLTPDNNFKFAKSIGNSWCNLVSYFILSKSPNIRYVFLHIPRSLSTEKAASIISKKLEDIAV